MRIRISIASGKLALVHNGVIENYGSIREELMREGGHTFISETDTEVLAHLIGSIYDKNCGDGKDSKGASGQRGARGLEAGHRHLRHRRHSSRHSRFYCRRAARFAARARCW